MNDKRKKEVAACGNLCVQCQEFIVHKCGDAKAKAELAANLTKETGNNVSPDEIGCEGCWGDIHNHLAASLDCKIRQCVSRNYFATCADCNEFPCETFLAQFTDDSLYANNIRAIKQDGLNNWLEKQSL